MTTHTQLFNFAGDEEAIYVGSNLLSYLSLESLKKNLYRSINSAFEISIQPYAVRLTSASTISGDDVRNIKGKLGFSNQDLSLNILGGLKVQVEIGILDQNNNFTDVFASVDVTISDISLGIDVSIDEIEILPANAKFIPVISRVNDADFEDIISRNNLDPTEVSRVEGLIAYSSIQSLITLSLNQSHVVNISSLFPGIEMSGRMKIDVIDRVGQSENAIAMIPTGGIGRAPGSVCGCADIGDGMGDVNSGSTSTLPDQPGDNVPAGSISIGGPSQVDPSTLDLGRRRSGMGDFGIYMPKPAVSNFGDGVITPAIRFDLRDNCFIGYKAAVVADFQKVRVDLDAQLGGIVVYLELRIDVYGRIRLDFGKLGKVSISNFSAEQDSNANKLEIAFIPVLSNGTIYLKPVLQKVDIGPFEVYLRVFKFLGVFGTKAAIIGFILDEILSDVIENQLPVKIRKSLKSYMANNSWEILDVNQYASSVNLPPDWGSTNYSVYNDTLVISAMVAG